IFREGLGDMFSRKEYLPSDMSHPLETLQRLEEQLVSFCESKEDAHLVYTLQRIEEEYSSSCVIADTTLSLLYCFLDTLQQAEEKHGSLHMFPDYDHLIETIEEQFGTVLDSDEYWNSEEPHIESILKEVAEKSHSFLTFLEGYHFPKKSRPIDMLQRIEEDWGSFSVFSDEYLSKLSHLRQTLQWIEHECTSFNMFLNEYQILNESESDFLHHMQHIWIEKEWGLSSLPTEKYLSSLDGFKFLKRDFKFLDIILNLHVCECGIDAINKVQRLFQGAAADLVQIYSGKVRPWSHHFHDYVSELQHKFWNTKTEIRRAKPNFHEGSLRLLANKDGIVILKFVMEYIETVADNLSDLLKLNDPNSPLMGQIEKALKELKFLNRLVCFVSDRCIKPRVLHTFFSHVLEVAWHTIMVIWLYFPSYECGDEEHSLFSNLIHGKFQFIHKIYIVVLRVSKLVQSQWYPVIQIKYVVDCGVRFLETLLYNLEELPISNNCKETKAILQEMCNFLRVNLINLPIQVTELHLQDVDSVIVDAGLLVYSLTYSEKANHDFPGKIQSMQAVIYIIIRKKFLLQLNLPGIDGVGSAKFILDNREMFQSLYSNSVDSVKSQLQKVQKELKCFQAVVEQQDGLQHFVTQTNGLVCETCDPISQLQKLFREWDSLGFSIIFTSVRQSDTLFSKLEQQLWRCKSEIRAKYSFPKSSLSSNKDNIATPKFAKKFIDAVVTNFSVALKISNPYLGFPLVPISIKQQMKKFLKELKLLRNFLCFVSDRCTDPQNQHTFFSTHVLVVVGHAAMVSWLNFLQGGLRNRDVASSEMNASFSDSLMRFQPIQPCIRKIYIDVLQALKSEQSGWHPNIQIELIAHCEAGFVETLIHSLEELPTVRKHKVSVALEDQKAILQEMLNFLRANLINLLKEALEDFDTIIIDVGLLVYSLYDSMEEKEDIVVGEFNQVPVLDFSGNIQSLQSIICLITRKSFHSNLPTIDGMGSINIILDHLKEFLNRYSDSLVSIVSQLQAIQQQLEHFQKHHNEFQYFAMQVIAKAYEVDHLVVGCINKGIPEWCLVRWIGDIIEE
ncbi:hypothetical protein HAX54_014653, partial [Datura stramonium]|nr:hypothetical protein [Datura stramonium]